MAPLDFCSQTLTFKSGFIFVKLMEMQSSYKKRKKKVKRKKNIIPLGKLKPRRNTTLRKFAKELFTC